MKILTLLVTMTISSTLLANGNRPEPPKREATRRGGEYARMLKENSDALNLTVKEVVGLEKFETGEYKYEVSKTLKNREMEAEAQKIKDLNDALQAKKVEIAETGKAVELASLLTVLNKVNQGRGDVVTFIETNDLTEAKDTLKLIDNLLVIIQVKVLEPTSAPVSTGQILRMMNIINGKIQVTGMTAQTFREIEAEITGILPKNYTMAKAARCQK